MTPVDLRSDTLTKPSAAMRAAMAAAAVGDDVWGEDPTVNELERETAATLGKEAALFVPSGTMGNLVAVLTHCARGDEMIVGDEAHVFYYELGGGSALGGVHVRTIPNRKGAMDPVDIERAVRTANVHFPTSRLLCIENTHNRGGGSPVSEAQTRAMTDVAHRHGLAVHLDGARLFNAAVALETSASTLAQHADSVNICYSKGLGAPVGSALAGSAEFIARARRYRKMVGGGMRQAGVLAAAALIALREGPKRLHEDHAAARTFAETLAHSGIFDIDLAGVRTNILSFGVRPEHAPSSGVDSLLEVWARAGVLVSSVGGGRFRAVTHLDVTRADVESAARIMVETLAREKGPAYAGPTT